MTPHDYTFIFVDLSFSCYLWCFYTYPVYIWHMYMLSPHFTLHHEYGRWYSPCICSLFSLHVLGPTGGKALVDWSSRSLRLNLETMYFVVILNYRLTQAFTSGLCLFSCIVHFDGLYIMFCYHLAYSPLTALGSSLFSGSWIVWNLGSWQLVSEHG